MSAADDYPLLGMTATLTPCTNECRHDHCARWRQTSAALDEIDQLRGAQQSANRWAHKATLLVLWIKENCTPEQAEAARAASQAPE